MLVTSDSDFARLASRLRKQGLQVFGIGRTNTPEAFRKACKQFIFVENLIENGEESRERGALRQSAHQAPKPETGGDSTRSEPEGGSGEAAPGDEATGNVQSVQKEPASKAVPLIMTAMRSHVRRLGPAQCHREQRARGAPGVRSENLRIQEARRLDREDGSVRGETERGAGAGTDEAVAVGHGRRNRDSQGLGPKKRCKRMRRARSSLISHSHTTRLRQQ